MSWGKAGSPALTRTDDAVGKTAAAGVGAAPVTNDFDTAQIFREINEVTDNYGNVFVRIPKFYIKKTDGVNSKTWQISKYPIDGGYLPKCFYDYMTGTERAYVDVGKYLASLSGDNKLQSKSGVAPLVNKTIANFRTYAKANGAGYQLMDIHVLDMLQTLFVVEFATLNSQSVMAGLTAGAAAANTGGTSGIAAKSGSNNSNSNGLNQMMFHGIEDLWGNTYQFVDGVNVIDGQAWVCENPENYVSDSFVAPYEQLSYINATVAGMIKEVGFDAAHPYANLPTVTSGASATTYYCDNYSYVSGARVLLCGYPYNGNTSAGLFGMGLTGSTGQTATFGARLVRGDYSPALSHWFSPSIDGKKVVLTGDSTIHSATALHTELAAATGAGGRLSGIDPANLLNYGNNGATTNDALGNACTYGITACVNEAANLYVVCYGLNDVRQGLVNEDTLVLRLMSFVNQIRAALPNADVVLLMPNSMLSDDPDGYGWVIPLASAQAYTDALRNAYLRLARQWPNVIVLDTQNTIFGTTCKTKAENPLMKDILHPNDAGNVQRAALLVNAIGQ